MNSFTLRHTAFALILFFSITLYVDMDRPEIQPWDEGLYAYRARAVLEHNVWWDQTDYAIGGLYSATYPPLTVDIMAVAMKFFPPNLAVRLFSFLSAIASLLLIFLIARRFINAEMSLMCIIGLAVTLAWDRYARQGMTDVPVVMFSLLALWTVLKISESPKILYAILWGLLFALSFAAALMSKILVSFLPLLFVVLFLFQKFSLSSKIIAIGGVIFGIILALPWHLYMFAKYGANFGRAFLAPHIYTAVEANTRSLGVGYYINQLIVANPFFILAIIFLLIAIFRFRKIYRKQLDVEKKYILVLMFVWFTGLLIVFSLSLTKLPHYLVYLTVPAVLLSAFIYEKYHELFSSEKIRWLIFSFILISLFWSLNFDLRQDIKLLLSFQKATADALVFVLISAILLITPLLLKKDKLNKLLNNIMPPVAYTIIIILIIRLIMFNISNNEPYILGGKYTADVLKKSGTNSFVYLYHQHNASDSLNPQLAWYTDGWNLGKLADKSFYPVPMPKDKIGIKEIQSTDLFKKSMLVYYVPDNKNLVFSVISEVKKTRNIMFVTKNYIIFGQVIHSRKKGKFI